jgi:Ca2+-binding RTX toxin-like protein
LNKIKAVGANFDINGVDILHDQGWITAWTDYDKIEYARYDSSGTMIVSATTASQSNELINAAIQTTALEDGGWIISWTANTNYFFDRFDASGNEVTTEGRLNPSPRNVGTGNTIALEGGGWVATWFYREHIYFQRFDSDGAKSGDVVEVNSIESYYGQYDVKASSDDGLVFSWNGPSPDNEGDQNIYQQRYDAHNDVIFSNTAPTGTDAIIDIREDRTYNFTNNTFGYDDINHQAVAGVYITKLPEHGSLMLGTKAVHQGEFISAEQIREMTWTPGVNENGLKYATIDFKVADIGDDANGGHHIDPVANSLTFNVTAEQDAFNGTDGNDILVGTSTSDLFFGGAGNDKLTGLGGLDVFDFRPDTGVDTITDFTVDGQQHDVIVFLHFDDLNSFSHLMHYHTEQSGKDVVIHDFDPENDGSKIILSNVKLEDLHAKDFYFQS